MLKAIEKLLRGEATKVGNHSVQKLGRFNKYYYHQTAICTVDLENRTFIVNDGGYGTPSTSRAINDYRKHFLDNGYRMAD